MKYIFKNISLLRAALTHSSYANEVRNGKLEFNERLEFLGDSVLNMLVAEYLYANYEELAEGELTRVRAAIVCAGTLHEIAKKIDLGKYLYLGKGEERTGGRMRASILADALEALTAAIYLDGGLGATREFLHPHIEEHAQRAAGRQIIDDYKTALQEIVQKNKQETLSYSLVGESGPDHEKTFTVMLYLNSNPFTTGEGKSKKEAEQHAAKAALELMGQEL